MAYPYTAIRDERASPSYGRLAAAGVLALSAGACVGLALSSSPAVSSLFAPAAVQPVASTNVVAVNVPRTTMQAMNAQYEVEPMNYIVQDAPVQMAAPQAGAWTVLSGGLLAAGAAMAAIFFTSSKKAVQSEQIAMLAASGKKASAAPKAERLLWYPTANPPAWLDGSLPGDRGFDPLGLAKPAEFAQFDLDGLDQNAGKTPAGKVIGVTAAESDQLTGTALQPYSEVFGLIRFRECELIHGRWAMLAVLGALVSEAATGIAWQDAGLYEVTNGANYWGNPLPFSNSQVVWFEVLAMGGVEIFRNSELNIERRLYPGGAFDPLGLAKDETQAFRLKEAELKHGRLAMLAFLGFALQALNTGLGATQSFGSWATNTWG